MASRSQMLVDEPLTPERVGQRRSGTEYSPAPVGRRSSWRLARRPADLTAHRRRSVSPLLIPCLLAVGYVILLVVRFPHLIAWQNSDSDVASAFTLTDAISHGAPGQVVMSTQGAWVSLWYGLLTHGLSFHRVLWEISPALLSLATACLIGWSVARVSTRTAGALTVALIVAASPTGVRNFTAAFFHNTTIPGVAILGAYLVWLSCRPRTRGPVVMSVVLGSLVVGAFLASDELLGVVGLAPFFGVSALLALRTRDRTGLLPVAAVTCGSVVVGVITSGVMRALDFRTTTPGFGLTGTLVGAHLKWLARGLLRMGNGLSVAPHDLIRTPLTFAAGIVTVSGLLALFWVAGRSLVRSGVREAPAARTAVRPDSDDLARARALHATFWAASLLCAATAYVITSVALIPSDRYFLVAIPAVAATVPLLLTSRRAAWVIAAAATVFVAGSIVALAANDERNLTTRPAAVSQARQIEAVVQNLHLGVGYAGYWEAAGLSWTTNERLHVYPVTDVGGQIEPMYLARVAAWYRPRPHTSSYLLLEPGDNVLADRIPRGLPRPDREIHLGQVTLATYPYDIAAYFQAPVN